MFVRWFWSSRWFQFLIPIFTTHIKEIVKKIWLLVDDELLNLFQQYHLSWTCPLKSCLIQQLNHLKSIIIIDIGHILWRSETSPHQLLHIIIDWFNLFIHHKKIAVCMYYQCECSMYCKYVCVYRMYALFYSLAFIWIWIGLSIAVVAGFSHSLSTIIRLLWSIDSLGHKSCVLQPPYLTG